MIILKCLIPCLLLSLGVGGAAGLIIKDDLFFYRIIDLPPLAPPSIVFPIVWSVLYLLMGIAHYLICVSDEKEKRPALELYYGQLAVNFLWPIIFFLFKDLLLSLIVIVVLLALLVLTSIKFYKIRKAAGYLMAPYVLWTAFASYLNIAIYFLNR